MYDIIPPHIYFYKHENSDTIFDTLLAIQLNQDSDVHGIGYCTVPYAISWCHKKNVGLLEIPYSNTI